MVFSKLIVGLLGLLSLLFISMDAEAICVKAPRANIRSGPGTHHGKTWEVYKYMPFKKIKRRGAWVKIQDVDGDRHWVHKKLITDNYRCAVVKKKKVNLRAGPGTKYPKAWQMQEAEKYTSFKLLKTKGKWAKVKDSYGDSFWVHRSLVWVY